MAALENILVALEQVLDDQEQAAFALRRISSFFTPGADLPEACESRASGLLDVLMILIKTEDDVDLAMKRISKLFMSLAASSMTSQKSDSSQQATSPSSSPSSAQVATIAASAEAESTSPVESEVHESPSTESAVSTITQSQRSSASTEETSPPPSASAGSTAPIKSEVPQPSTTIAVVADVPQSQQSSASAQDITSPPSTETKSTVFSPSSLMRSVLVECSKSRLPSASVPDTTSPPFAEAKTPAPAQSETVTSSSTTVAPPGIAKFQQTAASTASSQPPPAQPNGPLNAPDTVQPRQPLAPATVPQPSSAQPSKPRYSADQLTPSPHTLQPTYSPTDGAPLTYELAVRVGTYQGSSCVVLVLLIKYGGRNHSPDLKTCHNSVPLVEKLDYYDYSRTDRSMVVQRDKFEDHLAMEINIPHVSCGQYLDLYNSMLHSNPDDLDDKCRKILAELELAIVNRAEVYKWYESLPPTDARVAYNPRHLAFLQMFEKLEAAINHYLHTGTQQLIRR